MSPGRVPAGDERERDVWKYSIGQKLSMQVNADDFLSTLELCGSKHAFPF